MNGQSGTTGMAVCAEPKRSVIDVKVNQVWDQLDGLHGRISNLHDRLIPVVTPCPEVKGGGASEVNEPLSPLADVIHRFGASVATANARLDEIIRQLEL